jgi:energy-coupling factor transporter ATP-binding protein EcfA2
VDRDNEIRKILKSSEYLFLGGRITVLYGSKGCGKSTLFEAVSHAVKDSDFEAILIETVSADGSPAPSGASYHLSRAPHGCGITTQTPPSAWGDVGSSPARLARSMRG